jgi:YbgC/YbaW family acyl-CoA thioester hydrolase
MRKNKITCPDLTCFKTEITIQVGDLNYGGHVGNERYLLFAQETRIRFLESLGYSEMKFGPYGLVVSEASIEYVQELFHGDSISISMSIASLSRVGFDCFHTISMQRNGTTIIVAKIMTGMVCYDYAARKVRSIPEDIKAKLEQRISN